MNANELLAQLRSTGIRLYIDGEKLICDAPKHLIDEELLSKLKAHKSELVNLLKKSNPRKMEEDYEPPFLKAPTQEKYPLSYAQRRIMYLHLMQPGGNELNIAQAFELNGLLDIAKLEKGLKHTISKQELLRSYFSEEDNELKQIIKENVDIELNQTDLRALDTKITTDVINCFIKKEIGKEFNINKAPILRASLFIISDRKFILLLVSHYLVSDEQSLLLIARTICDYYNNDTADINYDKPSFSYVDYILWEENFLMSHSCSDQLQYWSKLLNKTEFNLSSQPNNKEYNPHIFSGKIATFDISADETWSLEKLAYDKKLTLFILTYSICSIILSKICKQNYFFCGTPIINRSKVETDKMLGYFANTLILGNSLSEADTFSNLLNSVRQEVIDTFSNSEIPFEYVLEKMQKKAHKYIRFMFTFIENDEVPLQCKEITANRLDIEEGELIKIVSELAFFIRKEKNILKCSITYAQELFSEKNIEYLIQDFKNIVFRVLQSSESTVAELKEICQVGHNEYSTVSKVPAALHAELNDSPKINYQPPHNELELKLVRIWEKILGLQKISANQSFFALGGTSFQAVKMFTALHKETEVKLPVSVLFDAPNIALLAKKIKHLEQGRDEWSCVVPIQSRGDRPPLFFVHGAGGNVLLYRDLSKNLGNDQPFYGIQAMGLDGKTKLLLSVEDMALHYINEIKTVQPEGPYYLGGYCLGGQIAYEMARILASKGERIGLLALLDTQRSWLTDVSLLTNLKQRYQQIEFHVKNFSQANLLGKLAFLKEKTLESMRRISRRFIVAFSTVTFKLKWRETRPLVIMERVNDRIASQHIALPYSGEVTLFRPRDSYSGYDDPLMGWGEVATGVNVQELSSYPAGMLVEPFVKELAEKLRYCVDKAIEQHANH